mgnify:CR=1 FL=1
MMTEKRDTNVVTGQSEKVLTFPKGIPGFEKYTTYVVYHKEENNMSAYWLESCEEPKVTFTVVDPGQYGLNYELKLTDEEMELLGTQQAEELGVFMILSKKEDSTPNVPRLNANIIGPLVVNFRTRIGLQKVLHRTHVNATIVGE